MSACTTMTIRISADLKEKLDRLAQDTQRSRSFFAGEAMVAYFERELEITQGIQRGLADVAAGRVVGHDAAIDAAARKT